MEKCLIAADVMKILGVSKPTVYKIMEAPDFPKIRVGRAIKVPASAFERWLDEKAQTGSNLLGGDSGGQGIS